MGSHSSARHRARPAGAIPGHPLVREVMNTHISVAREHDGLAFASQLLLWRGLRHLPVVDATGALVGVVGEPQILRSGRDPWSRDAPVASIMVPAEPIDADDEADVACRRLVERGVDCLVVLHEAVVCGLFTTTEGLASMWASPRGRGRPGGLTAADIMRRPRLVARPSDPLALLLDTFADRGVRHVPVVDAQGVVIGIVRASDLRATFGDLVAASDRDRGELLRTMRVADVMVGHASLPAEATLFEIAHRLAADDREAVLIITSDERLVGVVTQADVVRQIAGRELTREVEDRRPA